MKNRKRVIMLPAVLAILPFFSLNGIADQAQQTAQTQVSQANVSLLLRPDLAMGKIWIVKAGLTTLTHPPLPVTVLKKGEKYLFYCQYSNPGRALHGFWKLGYYIDGEMVWNQYWGDVPAGATQTKYITYTPTVTGSHTYSCQLDYDKEVVEKDENNNKAHIAFSVIL